MLMVSDEFYEGVRQAFLLAKKNIFVTSAFIKERALLKILQNISNDISVEVVGRWKKHDLLMKASDLEVYELCKANGWKFGIDQNLHGKLYLVDKKDVFLGSANLTQKGMSLGGFGNIEFGTRFDATQIDLTRIEAYKQREVVWINNHLFKLIKNEIDMEQSSSELVNRGWSSKILKLIETPVELLWVNELLFTTPEQLNIPNLDDESTAHDFEMLNLNCDSVSSYNIKDRFRQTKVYIWLKYQLKQGESLNFGGLTQRLHNSLIDDPLPYRKEVKEFVVILFKWMEYMSDDFQIQRHRHTSSVTLL